jgi:uncharacterized protein (DUF1330 family)
MVAYIIGEIQVTDAEKYKNYTDLTPSVIAEYGGKFIVRGGESVLLEGEPAPKRIVVIEFKDLETAKQFYTSPQYAVAKDARTGAATFRLIAVQGI